MKSVTILNHKPRQRKTAPTNQKHLSCERGFQGCVCWDVRCILKCNFFAILPPLLILLLINQGVDQFIVMEAIRENLQHMTTSKPKPYQRRWEGEGVGGVGESVGVERG